MFFFVFVFLFFGFSDLLTLKDYAHTARSTGERVFERLDFSAAAVSVEFERLNFSVEFVAKFSMVFVGGERGAVAVSELEFERIDFFATHNDYFVVHFRMYLVGEEDFERLVFSVERLDLFVSVSEGERERLDFVFKRVDVVVVRVASPLSPPFFVFKRLDFSVEFVADRECAERARVLRLNFSVEFVAVRLPAVSVVAVGADAALEFLNFSVCVDIDLAKRSDFGEEGHFLFVVL